MITLLLNTARVSPCALLILALLPLSCLAEAPPYARILPKASQSLLLDIVRAGDRLITVGERGHVLYSDDTGKSWRQARVPTTQMLTAVFFISPQKGWAVGHDGIILLSEDGGENWRLQRDGLAAQKQINLENREKAHRQVNNLEQALSAAEAAADGEQDSGVAVADLEMELEDAQMDLEDAELTMEEPVSPPPLMDIWFADEQLGWAVGAFGTLVQTDNGGQNWQTPGIQIDNEGEYHYYGIVGNSDGRIFIVGEAGGLYRSLNAGDSWETIASPYSGSWFGAVHSSDPENLLIFGLRGNVFRSTDFGDSWHQGNSDNTLSLAGGDIAADGTIVLVGSVGAVLHSADLGNNFAVQMQHDRLSLGAVTTAPDGSYYVVGQGGIHSLMLE